jgi:hypothetical protein
MKKEDNRVGVQIKTHKYRIKTGREALCFLNCIGLIMFIECFINILDKK